MKKMLDKWKDSYLFGLNADFIEGLYENYIQNPSEIDPKWKQYFDSLRMSQEVYTSSRQVAEKFVSITQHPRFINNNTDINQAQNKVWQLIENFRLIGVKYADLDPLNRGIKTMPLELDLVQLGLMCEINNSFRIDMDTLDGPNIKLKDIISLFETTYCGKIGFEYKYVTNLQEQKWLQEYTETNYSKHVLSEPEKIKILQKLTEAEGWERYLHTKYVGQKRFSLEGGESFIPALDRLLSTSAKNGIKEVFIGMAHRGRLNTLVNILGKSPQKIFAEFEGNYTADEFVTSGDVKYHKGYKCNYETSSGLIKTILAFNPSHLEVVNPVVNGMVRASLDKTEDELQTLGVLVHGDSALSGLGTNLGVLGMSQTRGFKVDGMIHIVINNQVGFTTSDIRDTRSSSFCTDLSKMIEAPVIHINADDLVSVVFAIDLAVKYRIKFKKDIMLDLVCFRRYGHNESDDPTLTQPFMYNKIKAHPGTRKLFADQLITQNIITEDKVNKLFEDYRASIATGIHPNHKFMLPLKWYAEEDIQSILKAKISSVKTNIEVKRITDITNLVTELPNNEFKLHATIAKLIDNRKAMGRGDLPIDFGMAETLAYGSLLQDGITVRLTGEDSGRGTFSHRHAVWHDYNRQDSSDSGYIPLTKLEQKNSKFYIYDSVLNEECVMGFEYGYSIMSLHSLVIWEAQYGDFANGAQVIIDQFIAAGETKWGMVSSLTLMLPHGYDGSGPEHSSARLERFLQLCAENNMQVVVPTTAAQMFHVLRAKGLANLIKPLVIFMSKKLLRYKDAMSDIASIATAGFKPVIGDNINDTSSVNTVIVCSGQIYYDLYNEREDKKLEKEIVLIRIEQLYPYPQELVKAELNKYANAKKYLWVQEEPYNQGAWLQLRDSLDATIGGGKHFSSISRNSSAAPATGLANKHAQELRELLGKAIILN